MSMSHSTSPQGTEGAQPPTDYLFEMEDAVRASAELAHAVLLIIERASLVGELDRAGCLSLNRIALYLVARTADVVEDWEEAFKARGGIV